MDKSMTGFTIVELLVSIVVIGILASISIVSYTGIRKSAQTVSVQSTIVQLERAIELYRLKNGAYPATTSVVSLANGSAPVFADSNCASVTEASLRRADWIPGLDMSLPQSDSSVRGAQGVRGCYLYVSNGSEYVLSAWNLLPGPATEAGYRRIGFREGGMGTQQYYCNHANIGGTGGGYAAAKDHYKYSYTVSNVTSCNETPPAGA